MDPKRAWECRILVRSRHYDQASNAGGVKHTHAKAGAGCEPCPAYCHHVFSLVSDIDNNQQSSNRSRVCTSKGERWPRSAIQDLGSFHCDSLWSKQVKLPVAHLSSTNTGGPQSDRRSVRQDRCPYRLLHLTPRAI